MRGSVLSVPKCSGDAFPPEMCCIYMHGEPARTSAPCVGMVSCCSCVSWRYIAGFRFGLASVRSRQPCPWASGRCFGGDGLMGWACMQAALQASDDTRQALDTELQQANVKLEEYEREQKDMHGRREAAAAGLAAAQDELRTERRRSEAAVAECRALQEKVELLESQMEALQVC